MKEARSRTDLFAQNIASTQDLASLRDRAAEAGTLQDMVTGEMSIDVILNVLDATGDDETPWPAMDRVPDIRSIALSNNAAMRLQVRDVERALSAPRPADALAPESVRQQLADLEARGALPLEAFRRSMEIIEHLQQWSQETLHDLAPDFSRLRQLLSLLPGAVQTTTPELPLPETQAVQQEPAIIKNVEPASADTAHPLVNIPAGISTKDSANSGQIRDRNDALAHLRLIRHWFESTEPSSPTIPLLRQAERLVGKRFSEVINEIPTELLKKWDTQE